MWVAEVLGVHSMSDSQDQAPVWFVQGQTGVAKLIYRGQVENGLAEQNCDQVPWTAQAVCTVQCTGREEPESGVCTPCELPEGSQPRPETGSG